MHRKGDVLSILLYFFRNMRFLKTGVMLFALLTLNGCENEKKSQAHAPAVGVVHVKRESIPLNFESAGKIHGSLEIEVRAQVGGILKERRFNEGEYVNKGDSLFLIDPRPYEVALKKASGSLAQAESDAKKAERDFKRMERLFNSRAVSQKEHDDSLSATEKANANLKVAQAYLEEAKINLEYTNVKAPISGIVRKESQSIGSLVSISGESAVLTSMVKTDPVKVQFSIAGTFWRKILNLSNSGTVSMPNINSFKVHVILQDGSVYPHDGKIIFVDSSEDNNTSTIMMKAELPNPNGKNNLMPGQFVRVRVVGPNYESPVIPSTCILHTANGNMVYVVNSEKQAVVRPVNIKLIGDRAVIMSGLKEGEMVISEGIIKVRPGAQITPVLKDLKNDKSPK